MYIMYIASRENTDQLYHQVSLADYALVLFVNTRNPGWWSLLLGGFNPGMDPNYRSHYQAGNTYSISGVGRSC